jgi:Flp pilus assembly protein TadG
MKTVFTRIEALADGVCGGLIRRTRRDRRGVAALEFALIFPAMIALYLGCVDVSQILTASRKASNVASAVADLVAQALQIDDQEVGNIFAAANAMLEPLPTDSLTVVISSVIMDEDGNIEVRWSDAMNASAHATGAPILIPDGLLEPGTSVIVAEVTYSYDSAVSELVTSGSIELDDVFYLRPRRTLEIARVD